MGNATTPSAKTLSLPGAVGITRLRVYDSIAPDGVAGGSPHVHLVCAEAYCVVRGTGAVQALDASGFREIPLETGDLVWFQPGLIHRLVNLDGDLEILVVMQNAGLPEAGDFVLTFPKEILAETKSYREATSLADGERVFATHEEGARRRRDLAVNGFMELRRRVEKEGPEETLRSFFRLALPLVQDALPRWTRIWKEGPYAEAQRTGARLDELREGQIEALLTGGIHRLPDPRPLRKLGMCGALGPYLPEGVIEEPGAPK